GPNRIQMTKGVRLSDDGKVLALEEYGQAHLWDVSGKEAKRLGAVLGGVGAFLPGGKALATFPIEGTLRLWDLSGGKQREVASCPTERAVSDLWLLSDATALVTGHSVHAVGLDPPGVRQLFRSGKEFSFQPAFGQRILVYGAQTRLY